MTPLLLGLSAAWACTVTSNASAGAGTLRSCIVTVNTTADDTITFSGAMTITPTTALPDITDDDVSIDGGGIVTLDGSSLGTGSGLRVVGASGVSIEELEIHSFPGAGIDIRGATGTVIGGANDDNAIHGNDLAGVRVGPDGITSSSGTIIDGNRIGLTYGDAASGNCVDPIGDCAGVLVIAGGGATTVRNNAIGANHGDGVRIHVGGSDVHDNLIGLSAWGTHARGNEGDGILVSGSSVIDQVSSVDITGNVIATNEGAGVNLAAYTRWATVHNNGIGVDIAGSALGNDGDGVRLLGYGHEVTGTTAEPTVIANNGGSGVWVAGYQQEVTGLAIGVNVASPAAAMGNAAYGIRVANTGVFGTAIGDTGSGNTVANNALGGIWLEDPNATVAHNVVGLDPTGLVSMSNGDNPLSLPNAFGGILATAGTSQTDIHDNLVAANAGPGIWVRGGVSTDPIEALVIQGNDIGRTGSGGVAGNDGDGILVEGADHVLVDDNVVANATDAGIALRSLQGHSTAAATVSANKVYDNGSHGIVLEEPSDGDAVRDGTVVDNDIHDNDGAGIFSNGGATRNELTHNQIADNEQCNIRDAGDSDTAEIVEAPYPTGVDNTRIKGSIDRLASTVARIEIYVDDGTHIGDVDGANMGAEGNFQLDESLPTIDIPDGLVTDDVVMLAVLDDGTTSEMTKRLGDGCVPDSCTPSGVDDLESCQRHWIDPGLGCQSVYRPAGYRCNDDDPLTGMINHRIDATEAVLYQDSCDGYGTCVGGTDLTTMFGSGNEADACPWKTDCNTATLDADGCTYAPVCGDSTCGVDDQYSSESCDSSACSECQTLQDADLDNVYDAWENGDFDFDCDGTVDTGSMAGPNTGKTNSTQKQVFLFIAYMSMDCSDEPGAPGATAPYTVHTHRPHEATMAEAIGRFDDNGYELVVEMVCIPEATVVHDSAESYDPDCNDVEDFTHLYDIKARYFPPHKRGIYHFALMGHANTGVRPDVDPLDGICTGFHFASGVAEGKGGDDARVVNSKGRPSDPLVAPDRASGTRTLIHEVGHNFGFFHGGEGNKQNQTPNHQSVMNFRYNHHLRLASAPNGALQVDYSPELLDTLDELYLDEGAMLPTTRPDPLQVTWRCPDGSKGMTAPEPARGYIDWNCNGTEDTSLIEVDISGNAGIQRALKGRDEWSDLASRRTCTLSGRRDWVYNGKGIDEETTRPGPLQVATVDVNPSCTSNAISLDDSFSTEAVLYGTADLDTADVLPGSARLAGAHAVSSSRLDVDSDGRLDLKMRFRPSDMSLLISASDYVYFNVGTVDGTVLWAEDDVTPGVYGDADSDGIMDPCE